MLVIFERMARFEGCCRGQVVTKWKKLKFLVLRLATTSLSPALSLGFMSRLALEHIEKYSKPPALTDRELLQLDQLANALLRQRHQFIELLGAEGFALRRALHLDNAALAGHDEIGVRPGF